MGGLVALVGYLPVALKLERLFLCPSSRPATRRSVAPWPSARSAPSNIRVFLEDSGAIGNRRMSLFYSPRPIERTICVVHYRAMGLWPEKRHPPASCAQLQARSFGKFSRSETPWWRAWIHR